MLANETDAQKEVVHRLAKENEIEPSVSLGKENLISFGQEAFP